MIMTASVTDLVPHIAWECVTVGGTRWHSSESGRSRVGRGLKNRIEVERVGAAAVRAGRHGGSMWGRDVGGQPRRARVWTVV